LTIPNLGERRHFDIVEESWKLEFSHRGIVEEFKEERDNFFTINDISKFTNSMMTIPNLGER